MLRETPKSLRWLFGILAALNFIIAAGAIAGAILARIGGRSADISLFFVTQVGFRLGIAVALAFVSVKLLDLLGKKSRAIIFVVHAYFWGSVIVGAMFLLIGGQLNPIGLMIAGLIYAYLIHAVGRLQKAKCTAENA